MGLFGKKRRDLEDVAALIEAIDGYRIGRNVDPKRIRAMLDERWDLVKGALGGSGGRKKLERVLEFMVNLPARDPSATRWSKVFLVVRLTLRVTIMLFVVALGLSVWGHPMAQATLIAATVLLYFVLVARWYSLVKLEEFYTSKAREQPSKDRTLKAAVESLVRLLAGELEREGTPPKRYRLHLFKDDYEGVRILKGPGILRETYLAEVVVHG